LADPRPAQDRISLEEPAIVLALILVAPFGVAACGGDDDKTDEDQIRDVVALGNKKDPEICAKVTDKWLKDVVGGDKAECEEQLKNSSEDAIEVKEISVDGDKATITADIEGKPGKLLAVKDGGDWKLDDIQQGTNHAALAMS
jgi:hypothetical protein